MLFPTLSLGGSILVDLDMSGLDLSPGHILSKEKSNLALTLANSHVNDSDFLIGDSSLLEHVELLDFLVVSHVENIYNLSLRDSVLIIFSEVHSLSSFEVILQDRHFEVVILLSLKNFEIGLPFLVDQAILDLGSNDHLGAIQKIGNDILKLRDQRFLVIENVDIDLFFGCNLKPYVTWNKECVSSHVLDFVDLFPPPD